MTLYPGNTEQKCNIWYIDYDYSTAISQAIVEHHRSGLFVHIQLVTTCLLTRIQEFVYTQQPETTRG